MDDVTTTPDPASDLGLTLGLVEIGTLLSSVLYGVIIVQSYKYYQASFKNDSHFLKWMVAFLSILETVQSVLQWINLYTSTVTFSGQTAKLDEIPWSFKVSIPLTTAIATMVQGFFSYRVSRLSGWQYYHTAFIIPTSLIRTGFAIASTALAGNLTFSHYTAQFKWIIIIVLVLGAAIDMANTVLLCLFMEQNHNPLLRSRTLNEKLISWIIETGLITSIYGVLIVALITTSNTFLWTFFWLQTSRLYCNALLSWLNGRISLRTAQPAAHIIPATLGLRSTSTAMDQNNHNGNLEVHIEMGIQSDVVFKDDLSLNESHNLNLCLTPTS